MGNPPRDRIEAGVSQNDRELSRAVCAAKIDLLCANYPFYASIAATVSRLTGRITPRSQIIAAISSAGVTSKAGL